MLMSTLHGSMQALTDAALTAALIYTLLSHIKTEIERTKNLLWRLICVALETGLLTTLGAIACLIASLAAPTTLISIAIALPLPHLYGLSLLSVDLAVRIPSTLIVSLRLCTASISTFEGEAVLLIARTEGTTSVLADRVSALTPSSRPLPLRDP